MDYVARKTLKGKLGKDPWERLRNDEKKYESNARKSRKPSSESDKARNSHLNITAERSNFSRWFYAFLMPYQPITFVGDYLFLI